METFLAGLSAPAFPRRHRQKKPLLRGRDAAAFLGQYLTEPEAHVFFTHPRRPLGQSAFDAEAADRLYQWYRAGYIDLIR